MKTISVMPMREVAVGLKVKLREYTIGPVAWGLWSLTFHDGSTYAAMLFDGESQHPDNLIGWACVSFEYDTLPMIGVYVPHKYRGKGHASYLCSTLLSSLVCDGTLHKNSQVYACTWLWSRYEEIIEAAELECVPWVTEETI